ncbi:MAG: methyltransferase domain-containing protein [Candidatus Aenigmarchaeota archaeon]|nr:methyltransferase domain-containing protein [Candidatus Aenigmarchaeota archaeon]
MTKVDEIVGFLKQNIKEPPKRILDLCCGYGELVNAFSSTYPHSTVYGLDINREALAFGIVKGRFKKAVPVHGDAFNLGKEDPNFTLVHFDPNPKNYIEGHVDLREVEHTKLKESLKDFDLVTAVNPFNKIPTSLFYRFQLGKLQEVPITPDIISLPAKKGGHVLYEMEIAHRAGMNFRYEPEDITEKITGKFLNKMINNIKNPNLEYVSHNVINGNDSKDLAVLFKKT